jgi:hypothetical protein
MKWKPLFFAEKNPFLTELAIATFPLTEYRAAETRLYALGFICWLIHLEAGFHGSQTRQDLKVIPITIPPSEPDITVDKERTLNWAREMIAALWATQFKKGL